MGQVTIYLDDETERRMNAATRDLNISKSKWIATVIREKLVDEWPDSIREMPGSWPDAPYAEELRDTQGQDSSRETL